MLRSAATAFKSIHPTLRMPSIRNPRSEFVRCKAELEGGGGIEFARVVEECTHLGNGSIEVIVGPMFSGKTTTLVNRVEIAQQAGRNVLAVKSALDSRYAKTESRRSYIVCHSGGKVECYSVNELAEVKEYFSEEYENAELLAIDEGQFFPDLVDFCTTAADIDGKKVCVAGLDGDFRRKPFELPNSVRPIVDLMPVSDKITKKVAECRFCDSSAPFTARCSNDTQKVLIGGADMYVPVCRRHYILKAIEMKASSKGN